MKNNQTHLVTRLLKWSWDDYTRFQYERGLEFISEIHAGDSPSQELWEHSHVFWSDWQHHWLMRDAEFVRALIKCDAIESVEALSKNEIELLAELHDLYKSYHSTEMIRNCPSPPALRLLNKERMRDQVVQAHYQTT